MLVGILPQNRIDHPPTNLLLLLLLLTQSQAAEYEYQGFHALHPVAKVEAQMKASGLLTTDPNVWFGYPIHNQYAAVVGMPPAPAGALLRSNAHSIYITMIAPGPFAAVGISNSEHSTMVGADIVVCAQDSNGDVAVTDYYGAADGVRLCAVVFFLLVVLVLSSSIAAIIVARCFCSSPHHSVLLFCFVPKSNLVTYPVPTQTHTHTHTTSSTTTTTTTTTTTAKTAR